MPPFVARKRQASTPPESSQRSAKKAKQASQRNSSSTTASVAEKKQFLESIASSDESSFSDADSDDFEDALPDTSYPQIPSEDENADWEDAIGNRASNSVAKPLQLPATGGNLELTLGGNEEQAALKDGKKKGPSKIERQIRISTHCMHVNFLMWHNTLRNVWVSDKKVHEILLAQLPAQIMEVIEQWRRDCGDALPSVDANQTKSKPKSNGKARKQVTKQKQRDWGGEAERLEDGASNLSRADPTLRMLKYLGRYWNKAFQVTAPGLRKHGYKSNKMLKEQMASFNSGDHDCEHHGERIPSINAFRDCAKRREGSRDVGAQLFTALCRALGLEARLVANLQPLGFGWNKLEEAHSKKAKVEESSDSEEFLEDDIDLKKDKGAAGKSMPSSSKVRSSKGSERSLQGTTKDFPLDLAESSDLSDIVSESEASIVDITPQIKRRIIKRYDRDLAFPTFWTEVISPISFKVYPVDSMLLLAAPATNDDHLAVFEPRGAKADKARQMIAYVVSHSPDGTAKDVTTRYLKRHMWPGKTKGMRMPVEKIAIYNRKGKVIRYVEHDWFKTVMGSYNRPINLRTQVDDIEDANDLKPAKIEKKEVKDGEESLQYYKQSAEFVLERFLRREEAFLPNTKPVKTFSSGKGDKAKEEPVFLRSDVVACKTEESWHKEGRRPIANVVPLKHVPIRAVTITRKREIEDLTRRNNGVKPTQPLYSKKQTEWIVPPPIENGVIPKNAYGNIDCFVPSMVPEGAVHVPLRSTARVCRKLGFDYAEAVVGFEFGNKMAVPVIQGVVIAEENRQILIDAWNEEEQARQVKEDEKRFKLVLSTWRKFLMGMRIFNRIRTEIGDDPAAFAKEEVNPFMRNNVLQDDGNEDEELEGGFLRDGDDEDMTYGQELEILDQNNSNNDPHPRVVPSGNEDEFSGQGGFMTDTPGDSADKVFDTSVAADPSSGLDSEDNEPLRRPLPKSQKKTSHGETATRRSRRSTTIKSKYFEDSSEQDEQDEGEESEDTGLINAQGSANEGDFEIPPSKNSLQIKKNTPRKPKRGGKAKNSTRTKRKTT